MAAAGAPLYVGRDERPVALSFGAVAAEGDARLFVPNILPKGVDPKIFDRWTSLSAKVIWAGELLEDVFGEGADILDVASVLAEDESSDDDRFVPLFVPKSEMDTARAIPGVVWDRRRRRYVASSQADFGLVHRYLTPAMRSAWLLDRNIDEAMRGLVRASALKIEVDSGNPREDLMLDPALCAGHIESDQ